MKEPTAAQIEVLKQTINDTSNDLEYVTEFLVAKLKGAAGVEESVLRQAVQTGGTALLVVGGVGQGTQFGAGPTGILKGWWNEGAAAR